MGLWGEWQVLCLSWAYWEPFPALVPWFVLLINVILADVSKSDNKSRRQWCPVAAILARLHRTSREGVRSKILLCLGTGLLLGMGRDYHPGPCMHTRCGTSFTGHRLSTYPWFSTTNSWPDVVRGSRVQQELQTPLWSLWSPLLLSQPRSPRVPAWVSDPALTGGARSAERRCWGGSARSLRASSLWVASPALTSEWIIMQSYFVKKRVIDSLAGKRGRGEGGNLPDIWFFNCFLLVLLSWRALIILCQAASDLSSPKQPNEVGSICRGVRTP